MVFNTGAALLDAVVLAVVSKEREGTYKAEWKIYASKISGMFEGGIG